MASEEGNVVENKSEEEENVVENESEVKEETSNGLKEETVEMSETITDNECVEEEGDNKPDKMDDSSDVIEEQNENTEEIVDTEVTKSESIVEKPTESEEQPSVKSVDKEKGDSEQKDEVEKRRRGKRTGRGALMKQLAVLTLPEGIILVKDRRYTGYHCTFCNCVLKSLATMRAHVGGKWHRRTLHMRMVNARRRKAASSSKPASPSKPASSSKSSGSPIQKVLPKEPLKSSLEEFLSTSKARIVGLSYVIETQRPNKEPTFQCNLCEVSCDSSDIKDHILGMKHCLMYSKLVKPVKLAELLAKQLTKAEKNKEIAKLSEELEKENGRGEITVKFLPAKSTPVRKPSNSQQRRRPGNRPFNRARSSANKPASRAPSRNRNKNSRAARRNAQKPQLKRRRDRLVEAASKRQMLKREFQDRIQYAMQGPQSNFYPGGWGMGNKAMDTFSYKRDAGYYRDYPDFYRDSCGERSFNRRLNEPYEQLGQFNSREMYRREKHDDRQSFWRDQRDNFSSSKPPSYNRSNRPASSALSEGNSRDAPLSALKQLAGINVTSEEDAGVVINAINSLTNTVMNYKLRDLSHPVQQLLQKSLKKNDLTSLLDLPDKTSSGSTTDRYGGSASDRYGGSASDRYGGISSDRYGGSASDRYGGRSSQAYQDWGINQIAKPKNWLF